MEKFYSNYKVKADRRSRESMIQFILNHRKHTESPYKRQTVANNIKITHLGLSGADEDAAFALLADEMTFNDLVWFDYGIDAVVFRADNPGWLTQIGGRSGGWIFLVPEKIGADSVFDLYDNLGYESSEYTIAELREVVNVIINFDLFCDQLRETFIDHARMYGEEQAEAAAEWEKEKEIAKIESEVRDEQIPFPAVQ